MRRLVVAAVALGALWPSAADAAKKTRVVVDRFSEPYGFAVDCSRFGPYAFENLVSGHQRVTVIDVLAGDGTLLQTIFKIGFSETDTNSVSGASLPLRGSVNEVWDYASNTRTLTGAVFIGTSRHEGTYVHDSGRITIDLDTREAQFLAGPHEAFFAGGVDGPVCQALSEAQA